MQIWELAFLSEKFIRFINETLPALSFGNLSARQSLKDFASDANKHDVPALE